MQNTQKKWIHKKSNSPIVKNWRFYLMAFLDPSYVSQPVHQALAIPVFLCSKLRIILSYRMAKILSHKLWSFIIEIKA